MSNELSYFPLQRMKTFSLLAVLLGMLTAGALAAAPVPMTDFNKTLVAASNQQKLAFILLGRSTCGICNATRAMIKEGRINVTAADYVMADLNIDNPRTEAVFMQRYGKQKFGDTLPFVVVTDSHGKLLASSGGPKSAAQWNALLASAKRKTGAKG
ncbi:hypothetical protein CfE428DRAFT_1767 [Chthoniobacter flavus Ellin428]|uniref:Thioredoxin domain-containing protein n=2 Tax=Chthoniobacter flavus TaxID=191863 RepID=B4CYM9_9BACT|nr:hypothetical protein CfE428DRAFT_1767 [Chthoniobacter flavus Ellin428]TCO89917.1 hypothetical protein EV701_11292 [Chthoniobacter flavus]